ncbi:hypothetical protein MLGJGCBP_02320 [Rhodococcus sp. T7]|nr:hypothetical protein MLGJGCBP_02320 [Rhodococcus sp. T7]
MCRRVPSLQYEIALGVVEEYEVTDGDGGVGEGGVDHAEESVGEPLNGVLVEQIGGIDDLCADSGCGSGAVDVLAQHHVQVELRQVRIEVDDGDVESG